MQHTKTSFNNTTLNEHKYDLIVMTIPVFLWLVSSVQELFKSNMKACKVQRGKAGTVKYLTNYDITHNSSML